MNLDNENAVNKDNSLKEIFNIAKDWYNYFLTKWKLILLAGFIGAIIGLSYSLIKKPIYTSSLSFALEEEESGGGLGSALGLASQFGLDVGGSGGGMFIGSNLTVLFKSRSIVEKTLLSAVLVKGDTITLAEMYIQNKNWRKKWDDDIRYKNIQFLPNSNRKLFTRVQDSILGVIYDDIYREGLQVAQKDKKISIITIDVLSTNELFAKKFTESLATEVSDFYITTKSKKSRMNMSILQRQTDSIRMELNGAIKGVAVANDNTFNLNPALNVRRAPAARRQVDVQANTAILTELVKQSEMAKVTLRKDTPLIQIIDRPILPLKKEETGMLKGMFFGAFFTEFLMILFLIFKRFIS